MTDFEDRLPPAVGAYWVKEEDYPALLKVSDDGNKMPRTWKEWLKIAEEMERGLKAYGHVVMRVHIDPKTSNPQAVTVLNRPAINFGRSQAAVCDVVTGST